MTQKLTFDGKLDLDGFYSWLNPELPHAERFDPARLLSSCVEVDEPTYRHFLEVLPPVYFPGGFAICEATTGDIRLAFFEFGVTEFGVTEFEGRYFAAYVSDHDAAHKPAVVRARIDAVESGKAWEGGYDAYVRGEPRASCQLTDEAKRTAWFQGWVSAFKCVAIY